MSHTKTLEDDEFDMLILEAAGLTRLDIRADNLLGFIRSTMQRNTKTKADRAQLLQRIESEVIGEDEPDVYIEQDSYFKQKSLVALTRNELRTNQRALLTKYKEGKTDE